jgi:membrane protein YqaA with SNARE-associated domain
LIRRLYDWTLALAGHRHATAALAAISFAESSIFPIPPDALLVPMCIAHRARAFFFGFVCTVASVAGGLFGYAIGYMLYETIGVAIVRFYGLEAAFEGYRLLFAEWGLWIILIKGLTPIPYKVVTIASGLAEFDLLVFTLASIATRGARFMLEAALLWRYGQPIRRFIERRLELITTLSLVAIVVGILLVKYAL